MAALPNDAMGAQELAEHIGHIAKNQGEGKDGDVAGHPDFCSPGTPARSDALLVAQAVSHAMTEPQQDDEAEDLSSFEKAGGVEGAKQDAAHEPSTRTPSNLNPAEPNQDLLTSDNRPPRAMQACAVDEDFEEIRQDAVVPRDNPRERVVDAMSGQILLPRNKAASAVVAWGCAHNYQLGTGQYVAQDTPIVVSPLLNLGSALVDISCGGDHCGAVDESGKLYTWGLSDHGRLGLHSARDAPMPSVVRSLGEERVVAVTCGMYSSACISEEMRVFTWGAGGDGQLGHGDKQDEWVPRLLDGLQGCRIVQVAMGFRHSLALSADGRVFSWGEGGGGQLGHGDCKPYTRPKEIEIAEGVLEGGSVVLVGGGAHFSALLSSSGRVLTTGSSEYGALGLGGRVRKVAAPTVVTSKVLEKRRFVHLAVGEEHCAAVTSKGNVYTWGQGCFGAVGKAPPSKLLHPPDCPRPYRLPLPEGKRAVEVACGGNYTAMVLVDGEVMVLGDDDVAVRSIMSGGGGEGKALQGKSVRCGRFHTMVLCELESVGGVERAGGWLDSAGGWLDKTFLAPLKTLLEALGARGLGGGAKKRRGGRPRPGALPPSLAGLGAGGLVV